MFLLVVAVPGLWALLVGIVPFPVVVVEVAAAAAALRVILLLRLVVVRVVVMVVRLRRIWLFWVCVVVVVVVVERRWWVLLLLLTPILHSVKTAMLMEFNLRRRAVPRGVKAWGTTIRPQRVMAGVG